LYNLSYTIIIYYIYARAKAFFNVIINLKKTKNLNFF